MIPLITAGTRRLHDIGKSGCYWFLSMIPFGYFVLIYFFCLDSDMKTNMYGPSPKYPFSQNLVVNSQVQIQTPIIVVQQPQVPINNYNIYPNANVYPNANAYPNPNANVYPNPNVYPNNNENPNNNINSNANAHPPNNEEYSKDKEYCKPADDTPQENKEQEENLYAAHPILPWNNYQ